MNQRPASIVRRQPGHVRCAIGSLRRRCSASQTPHRDSGHQAADPGPGIRPAQAPALPSQGAPRRGSALKGASPEASNASAPGRTENRHKKSPAEGRAQDDGNNVRESVLVSTPAVASSLLTHADHNGVFQMGGHRAGRHRNCPGQPVPRILSPASPVPAAPSPGSSCCSSGSAPALIRPAPVSPGPAAAGLA